MAMYMGPGGLRFDPEKGKYVHPELGPGIIDPAFGFVPDSKFEPPREDRLPDPIAAQSREPVFVYLAGPIGECTYGEANTWREYVTKALLPYNIRGVSPLRCEPIKGDRYSVTNPDPRFGTQRAISSKNKFDVRRCPLTFAHIPRALNDRRPSYGTICEIAWAHMIDQQTILVTDCPILRAHPVVQGCVSWSLDTLEEGIETTVGLLQDYAR